MLVFTWKLASSPLGKNSERTSYSAFGRDPGMPVLSQVIRRKQEKKGWMGIVCVIGVDRRASLRGNHKGEIPVYGVLHSTG